MPLMPVAQVANQLTITGSTIASFPDSPVDGQAALLRAGSSPYEYVSLVYDATYGKWVSAAFCAAFAVKNSAITASNTTYGNFSDAEVTRMYLPNFKALYDAGLRLQANVECQLNTGDGSTAYAQAAVYEVSDGETNINLVGTAGEISVAAVTATYKFSSGWQDFGNMTLSKTAAFLIMQRKVSGNNGTFGVPATWLRWVAAPA